MTVSKISLDSLIDFNQPSLYYSLGMIYFNPLFWNIVARNEYHHKWISSRVKNPYTGCYILAATIFSLGLFRDALYTKALKDQPVFDMLPAPYDVIVPAVLVAVGQIFVISSTWQLGITGTFLGDYFGILMDEKVEAFPFNILSDPMYVGSTLTFAGGALWHKRPAGLFISAIVWIVYSIALTYEGPFTNEIYAKRERERALKAQKSS
ncbi:Phosphatidyl-N-methylethanolamine N-methyltransferase [Serendipita sp. 411]|nr:Phosphatidyl-N-methylethanolamine N-methyltransferase [Serendipita sp. 397]KAG8777161.1 Phosphatidyl-N-methylethanolamine N-methyltransferase [Serendipita sp. 398]KAG8842441.1 Phosphatidyl-N-methylethanolamine N-methyltransferase [Serendipita sp. 405]KAG8842502.1 Phosphatidyl-N-methylethanolamine N-methyltransferase [Serendipita sp. 411]